MRKGRVAEFVLSLVVPGDRAAAITGDLIESAPPGGGIWFWTSLAYTIGSLVLFDIGRTPVRMLVFGVIAWFVYMAVALVALMAVPLALGLLWPLWNLVANHTGVELVVERVGGWAYWPFVPQLQIYAGEAAALFGIAPFVMGRVLAHAWPGRELSAWTGTVLLWIPMLSLVPFVAWHTAATLPTLPAIAVCLLAGALTERSRRERRRRVS
jgi:hypothetical protein